MSRRVLVTGASGFVGANLARRLLADGHDVHLLLRADHKPWRVEEIRDHVTVHEAEVSDFAGVEAAVRAARPEWIFHLAAYGAYPQQKDHARMIAVNVHGTGNLLRAAEEAGFEAFVNSGTSSEYGYKDHAPSEDEEVEPNSHYAETKAEATLFCHNRGEQTGLRITTLRLYSAFGPYEEPSRLVPTLIVKGLEGHLPPLVNPNVARDYVHVDDVCDAYLLAAQTLSVEPGAIFNVGTGVQTTLAEIVAVAKRLLPIKDEPEWGTMPDRSWDTNVWVSNPTRIKADLGWTPGHDLESGLQQMIDWFKSSPAQLRRYRDAISGH